MISIFDILSSPIKEKNYSVVIFILAVPSELKFYVWGRSRHFRVNIFNHLGFQKVIQSIRM